MIKKCTFCGNKNFRNCDVQYIYRHNGKMLLVNNVPCVECEYCGERFFASVVLKRIEQDFDAICNNGKKATRTVKVPVEEYAGIKKLP
ncbi:MAG: YgiT-type zinc finger protein [Candidatus Wallbacteria bacterium]|nr:YgiT-type zinc finger protein [Candidatus Wallbacteria bacterium]